jgi:preprotein translocase subunit SecA
VVTLLLLLGIASSKGEKLANRMAEVGTGEGKSIILAVMSAYLVVVGYNVRCVCYSQYLSERDFQKFK